MEDTELEVLTGHQLPPGPLPSVHLQRPNRQTVDDFLNIVDPRASTTALAGDITSTIGPDPNPPSHPETRRSKVHWFRRRHQWSNLSPFEPPVVRQLEQCPNGYPRFAAFLDSDDDFLIFRRFGYLQARLLLEKQACLSLLEEQLDEFDNEEDWQSGSRIRWLSSIRRRDLDDSDDARKCRDLLERIERTFCEYSTLLTAAQQMRGFERPSEKDYKSVKAYEWNERPIVEDEAEWLRWKEDLVALKPKKEPDRLERTIEAILGKIDCKFIRNLFVSKEPAQKTNSRFVHYYSPKHIQRLVTALMSIAISILLVLPITICYFIVTNVGGNKAYGGCIGVLLFFTLIFSIFMILFSSAKRHEILATTSAYCAVLVVFLGNVGK